MMDRETDENGDYLGKIAPRYRSFTFHGSAPQAYQLESEFKGAGVQLNLTETLRNLAHLRVMGFLTT